MTGVEEISYSHRGMNPKLSSTLRVAILTTLSRPPPLLLLLLLFLLLLLLLVKLRYPCAGLDRSLGLHEVEAPRIPGQLAHEGGKVLAQRAFCLYPPGDTPGPHFC